MTTTSCRAATATTSCPARPATTASSARVATTSCRAATGDDSLDGGDGDDDLDGGDGDDFLSDFAGTNSFAGGLGNDQIVAGSTDGAQTIDGGDGNDTIRHYYRSLREHDHHRQRQRHDRARPCGPVGTAAIIVTDFTAGAGGDMFRLSGDDGALLSLLSGWDGSSNPFGSGFLRLQQSGADTLLAMGPGRRRRRLGLGDAGRLREHRCRRLHRRQFRARLPSRRIRAGGRDDHRHR